MGNVFCSKSLDTTSGTAIANEATTFLLHLLISDGGAHFTLKIRHWLALGCIGSHMCAERISVVWCVLLLTLYFYGAFGWSRYTLLRKARAADDSRR